MGNFFGTDGIRGIVNKELTCELAIKVGKAAAKVLVGSCGHKAKILIGKDTRISSNMLECALLAGICSMGSEGVSLGVVPTPAVAYLVKKYKADAGIMISASHNSFEFNGIKLFDKNGFKLPDNIENQIEEIIMDNNESINLPIGESIGEITYLTSAADDYINYIKSTCKKIDNSLKIAVDCANGSASITAQSLFEKIGANAVILSNKPCGTNINDGCGSTHPQDLIKYVTKNKCHIGIAFDGDADRCIGVDETGNIIDGDSILAICAKQMQSEGTLKNTALVGTIMSNLGLKKFCEREKINFFETKVGDRYVLEKMRQDGHNLGGEQSGHVIFSDYSSTGDGQLTAVQLLNILSESKKKSSELNALIIKYPQKSTTITISQSQKGKLEKSKEIAKYLQKTQKAFDGNGRIVVRESGTEPKIRIMVEHKDKTQLEKIVCEVKKFISESLN